MAKRTYSDKECFAILESFRKSYILTYSDPGFTGAGVRVDDDGDVRFAIYSSIAGLSEATPSILNYNFERESHQIEVITESRQAFRGLQAGFHDGEAVSDPNSQYSGTGGWSIFLDLGGGNMPLVCVSNWHVFCQVSGNNTQVGIPIDLNGFDATLFAFNNVNERHLNDWDFALARFNNYADRGPSMRVCNDGTAHPRPIALSANVRLNDGAVYRKIGNGNSGQVCLTGALREIGDSSVNFMIGSGLGTRRTCTFKNQLLFDDFSTPGDSGSAIVRVSDNTVTGLLSASAPGMGTNERMMANPLYTRSWRPRGVVSFEGGEVPIFEALDVKQLLSDSQQEHQFSGGFVLPVLEPALSELLSAFPRSVLIGFASAEKKGVLGGWLSFNTPPIVSRGGLAPTNWQWSSPPPPNNVGAENDMTLVRLNIYTIEHGEGRSVRYDHYVNYAVFEPL